MNIRYTCGLGKEFYDEPFYSLGKGEGRGEG